MARRDVASARMEHGVRVRLFSSWVLCFLSSCRQGHAYLREELRQLHRGHGRFSHRAVGHVRQQGRALAVGAKDSTWFPNSAEVWRGLGWIRDRTSVQLAEESQPVPVDASGLLCGVLTPVPRFAPQAARPEDDFCHGASGDQLHACANRGPPTPRPQLPP